jgi:hypothetical protein
MNAKWGATQLVLFLFCIALLAQPAEARRRFAIGGGGSSSGETIDLVRDLPDTETFEREGEYWDLGYLYRQRKAFGVTVSSDKSAGFFVLYRGDRYVKLDEEGIALLAGTLGEDPTVGYRSEAATASASGAAAGIPIAADAAADRRRAPIGGDGASASGTGGGVAGALVGMLIVVGLALLAARKLMGGVTGLARTLTAAGGGGRHGEPGGEHGPVHQISDTFEQRVAARLAELERGPAVAPAPAAAPAAAVAGRFATAAAAGPAVRGFGRKTA